MSLHPKGKHVSIDPDNPEALGICDYSGFVFLKKDLVRQMVWSGNNLIWNGFYVGKPYVDVPNEQGRAPILPPDPVPERDPRVMQNKSITFSQGLGIPWNQLNVYPFCQWGSFEDGAGALSPAQNLQNLQNYNWGW